MSGCVGVSEQQTDGTKRKDKELRKEEGGREAWSEGESCAGLTDETICKKKR